MKYIIEAQTDGILVTKRQHGQLQPKLIPYDFFASKDYQKISEFSRQLQGLIQDGAYIKRGEQSQEIETFEALYDWLLKQAKKGQNIQRYKGLGEMNPDQLWETTMDPINRRMLQVTIEDAVAADEMFSTLMGDNVEPRRNFIVSNALSVENLDV
jgi:DNA gyrase subunit B